MSARFPDWPSAWLEESPLSAEEALVRTDAVELVTGLRADGQVLLSVRWTEGRRYMLVDPVDGGVPQALRTGEPPGDPEVARAVEAVWSQALKMAKALLDGDLDLAGAADEGPEPPPRRRWGRRGR